MPIIKSAIKRVRQTSRRTKRNLTVKSRYRALIKEYIRLLETGKKAEAAKMFPSLQKAIDMAAKRNLLHKNTAGRRKSVLVKMLEKDMVKKDPRAEAKKKKEAAPKKKAAPAKEEPPKAEKKEEEKEETK